MKPTADCWTFFLYVWATSHPHVSLRLRDKRAELGEDGFIEWMKYEMLPMVDEVQGWAHGLLQTSAVLADYKALADALSPDKGSKP